MLASSAATAAHFSEDRIQWQEPYCPCVLLKTDQEANMAPWCISSHDIPVSMLWLACMPTIALACPKLVSANFTAGWRLM